MINFISMKKAFLILILLYASCTHAQHTVMKKWDARFGGTGADQMAAIALTNDGGYILAGTSASSRSGDKTQSSLAGSSDYWIVKTDADGHYLWDRQYGGIDEEMLTAIYATSDGGCIIGGTSGSDSTGDMTQRSRGGWDFWVVKIDALGNKQWDKRFGGSGGDFLYTLKQTMDGGYILGGRSSSGISGDKTQDCRGLDDYWIVKTDGNGTKQWDKRFGSIWDEACVDILQTPEGGYLLGGSSPATDTSGDKTQPNFGPLLRNFWVVKTDSLGTKLWDKVYGGTSGEYFGNSLNTADGSYMLSGNSFSLPSGNKTANKCGYWAVLIDTSGNKLSDWAYGSRLATGDGDCAQSFGSMISATDGGYYLTGVSGPDISGDKTDSNLASTQIWTIRIDSQMHRVWDKTTLTTDMDISAGVGESSQGCYVVGVQTLAGIGGDKTQPSRGNYDYWVVEYCDTVLTSITETAGDIRFSIYPNPTAREVSIHLEQANLKEAAFTLTNTQGQLIYQSDETNLASSYTKILDLGTLPSGIYLLDVTTSGQHIVRKILKE
ncbi:MAG: hypothetical protein JWO03_1503 [Bacteroidetes bacterium]|nr:hypothetical protein [Bacteroidota bacterium]